MKFVYYFFVLLQLKFVLLCNGSTADSGSVCLGSNPSRTTKKVVHLNDLFLLNLYFYLAV